MLTGAVVVVVSMLALSACGGSQRGIASPALVAVHSTLPAPLVKRLATEARGTARSLGDTSIKTAQVYGPDSRYLLVKASSGDLVQKTAAEWKGFYLIVLHGHFVCHGCSVPPGAKLPRGTVATEVWSPKTGQTDFGLGNRSVAMSHLRGPALITLAVAPTTVRDVAAKRKKIAEREAQRVLDEFVRPPGARAIQVRPGDYSNAHVLHQSGGEIGSEFVDVHHFFKVRKPLKAVTAFIRTHRLHGFGHFGALWYTGKPHYLSMGSSWPAAQDSIPRRFFDVTVVGLSHVSVLRVEARVVWTYPRPPSEKVPHRVRMIDIHVPQPNHVRIIRVINPAKVARIVHWFNALPVSPPGVHVPCLGGGAGPDITLSFRSATGDQLAQAKAPPGSAGICAPIRFRIGRRSQLPLIDRPFVGSFVADLQSLLGVRLVQNVRE